MVPAQETADASMDKRRYCRICDIPSDIAGGEIGEQRVLTGSAVAVSDDQTYVG
jgi:hypothetical protein